MQFPPSRSEGPLLCGRGIASFSFHRWARVVYFYLQGVTVEADAAGSEKMVGPFEPQTFTGGGGLTSAGRRRICFQLQFDTSNLPQYLKDHEAVWPEMQQALVSCGWHNYSLFFRPDGYAIGYFETDVDFTTACARMDATEVNARWQATMAKYTPKGLSPLEEICELQHYFYLGTDRLEATKVEAAAHGSPTSPRMLAATFVAGLCCAMLIISRGRGR